MTHGDPRAAVTRLRTLAERARLEELAPGTAPAVDEAERRAAREGLDDELRLEAVAALVRRASSAVAGRQGEQERQPARAIVGAYLDRACRACDDELAAITRAACRATPFEEGFEAALAFESDPLERARRHAAWVALEGALEPARAERRTSRDAAARAAGRESAFELAASAEACDPALLAAEVERGAVAPLDAALRRAARERCAVAGADAADEAAAPRVARLADLGARFDRARVAPVLRALGAALGEDPDTSGPALLRGGGVWTAAVVPPGDRPAVVLGSAGGPGGLRCALEAFGCAARSGAVARRRGAEALVVADPAFEETAARLLARLTLSPPFRAWAGLREDANTLAALRLEEARVPRRAWALLRTAACRASASEARATLERACGSAVPPGAEAQGELETKGAAVVRGAILAALLEERLMTRHGRAWFLAREAGRMLHEIWEAEPDETADSVAQALSLGRMTMDVLVEAFRP